MKRRIVSLFLLLALLLAVPAYAAAVPEEVSGFCTQTEWDILTLTNQARIEEGLPPLCIFPKLQSAADVRERELAVLYSHQRPNGSMCVTALDEMGLQYYVAAENIATGYTSAAEVMNGWMTSPGHRANILAEDVIHLGVGHNPHGGLYGTSSIQFFLSKYCAFSNLRVSQDSISLPRGGSLDDQNLYLSAVCSDHGQCYLPLLPGMYSGFSPNTPGKQNVTIRWAERSTVLQVLVSTFNDISAGAYFGEAVAWAVDQGIANGTSLTTFSPDQTCTTAHILTFLWRASGSPKASGDNPFTDVKDSDWFAGAALWAHEKGMVTGSLFHPNTPCTRSMAVKYLWQAAGSPAAGTANFSDVPAGADYAQAVNWAVEKGITNGTSLTTFSPDTVCTRAHIVTFLYRDMAK